MVQSKYFEWGDFVSNKKILMVIVIVILALTGTILAGNYYGGSNRNPEGVVFILPERGVDHIEFTTSKNLLEENGIKVTLASTIVGEISDDQGEKYKSTILIKNVDVDDYKLIAVMGGNGMKLIEFDEDTMKLLQNADKQDKYIGAICYGPVLLARSGILESEEATVYPNSRNKRILRDNGAKLKNEKLVVSGNIVTAAGPDDSQIFAEKLVDILKNEEQPE